MRLRAELIEEGFVCPTHVPYGFLLLGGGVACVGEPSMPPPLGTELEGQGHQPATEGCFGADPAPSCLHGGTTTTGGAFDLTDAKKLSYSGPVGPWGPCHVEGELVRFDVDLQTRAASARIVASVTTDPNCNRDEDPCATYRDAEFELSEDELAELLDLVAALPAPVCEIDEDMECDNCIDSISVDEQHEAGGGACCGEITPAGFNQSYHAIVVAMLALVPPFEGAFTDVANFEQLTYQLGPGDGWCIEADDKLEVTITREGGGLAVEGEVAVLGDEATDDCLPEVLPLGVCLVREAIAPQTLTVEAQVTLESLLTALPAPMCVLDPGLACDPCRVETLNLDGTSVNGECCGTAAPQFLGRFDEVADFIQAL